MLDLLLPGDGQRWPAFSHAVNVAAFLRDAPDDVRAMLARTAALPAEQRSAALARTDAAEMAAVIRVATDAYYTAAPVLAVVRALADAAPREASAHVDPMLVVGVLARARREHR